MAWRARASLRPARPAGQAPGQPEAEQRAFGGGDQGSREGAERRLAKPAPERRESHLRARRGLGHGIDGASDERGPVRDRGRPWHPPPRRTRLPFATGLDPTGPRCRLRAARSSPRSRPRLPLQGIVPRGDRQGRRAGRTRCRESTRPAPGEAPPMTSPPSEPPARIAAERAPGSRNRLGRGDAGGDTCGTREPGNRAERHQHRNSRRRRAATPEPAREASLRRGRRPLRRTPRRRPPAPSAAV